MYRQEITHQTIGANHQTGAALVISLILLLILTVVGVSSMDVAVSEIKMATTMQREEMALRRAERTLLDAEEAVENLVRPDTPFEFGTTSDGFYRYSNDPNDPLDPRKPDWSEIHSENGPISTADALDDDDAFVVEYQGSRVIPGEVERGSPDAPVAGGLAYVFRNTTRSASGKNAVRLVESVYATHAAP